MCDPLYKWDLGREITVDWYQKKIKPVVITYFSFQKQAVMDCWVKYMEELTAKAALQQAC